MKENVLKKQFAEKDVQRLRNLVQGKYADKSQVSVGYQKEAHKVYNEGDVWEEDNRTWTIKDGIKQNVTKLDKAKEAVVMPLFCPVCSKMMKPRLDKKWFSLYKHCFNCQIEFETALRISGQWETYLKEVNNQGIEGLIKDFEVWMDEEIKNKDNDSFITEAGDIEKWSTTNINLLLKQKEETIKFLQSLKKD